MAKFKGSIVNAIYMGTFLKEQPGFLELEVHNIKLSDVVWGWPENRYGWYGIEGEMYG